MKPEIRSKLQSISQFMIDKSITVEVLHKTLDTNNDNLVDKEEFVEGIIKLMGGKSLTR